MPQNTNQYGPGNPKKPKRAANAQGAYNGTQKKSDDPFKDAFGMGGAASPMSMDFGMGSPAANPMGNMGSPMGDMGGMTGMNAAPQQSSYPSMGGYNQQQQDRLAINGDQPSGFQGKMNPGVLEGTSTVGGGIADFSSMGSQLGRGGANSMGMVAGGQPDYGPYSPPQFETDGDGRPMVMDNPYRDITEPLGGWGTGPYGGDPTPGPRPGDPDHWGSPSDPATGDEQIILGMGGGQGGGWNDPGFAAFGGQMQQPEVFPGNPLLGQQAGAGGGDPIPKGEEGWIRPPWDANEYREKMEELNPLPTPDDSFGGFSYNDMKGFYDDATGTVKDIAENAGTGLGQDASRLSRSGNSGGPQADFMEAQVAGPNSLPTTSQFNEEVAPLGDIANLETPEIPVIPGPEGPESPGGRRRGVSDHDRRRGDYEADHDLPPPDNIGGVGSGLPVSRPPTASSAYPPMVKDASGNMVTDPDYQSGEKKDYREMLEPSRRKPYMPPNQGPAGSPMDSDLEAEWREKNPGQPLPDQSDDTPEIAGGPAGALRHVPTREEIIQSAQQEMGTHRYNHESDEWERKSEEEIAAREKKYPGQIARQEEWLKQRLAEFDKKPPEDTKPEQVTIDGKQYWKESDRGKPGVPESGIFSTSEGLLAIDGKDVWGDPEAVKPALEEFKDKVDAGEVSDEEPTAPPPQRNPVRLTAEEDEAMAVWSKFNADMAIGDRGEGVLKELGIDKDYMLKMKPVGGNQAPSQGRRKPGTGITMFKGPDGRRFQRKVTKIGGGHDWTPRGTWTEVGKEGPADEAIGTASSESRSVPLEAELPRTGKIHTNRTTMESYNDLGERVDPITGQVIDAKVPVPNADRLRPPSKARHGMKEVGEKIMYPGSRSETTLKIFEDENGKQWSWDAGWSGDMANEGGLQPYTPDPEDKFSEVGEAAYGDENGDGIPDMYEPTTGMGIDESGGAFQAPEADAGSASPEDLNNPDNWDTSGGGYVYRGAEFGKTNTSAPADTADWAKTRAAAADKSYYNKLVNPDDFNVAPQISFPPGYGNGQGGDGKTVADAKFDDLYDENGEPLMGPPGMASGPIESDAGGMSVLDTRMRGTKPAQVQALVNNAVADSWGGYNQGVGGTAVSAGQGMDADMGTFAQQKIAPMVAQNMASAQAQIGIPWQYAQEQANSVRERRALAHKLGLTEAQMIQNDYYDNLRDKMATMDTDNIIMRQMYGEMPDNFG